MENLIDEIDAAAQKEIQIRIQEFSM